MSTPIKIREFRITCRYLVPDKGWQAEETKVNATMEAAWQLASNFAHILDEQHGDSHFWTVNLDGEHGSVVQLFHGRLV